MTRQFGEPKTRKNEFERAMGMRASDIGGFHCTRDIRTLFSEPGAHASESSPRTFEIRSAA